MSEHYVYRLFNAADDLLYIGCTGNVSRRVARHKSSGTGGGAAIHRVAIETHPDRRAALNAEAAAILAEQPPHNERLKQRRFPDLAVVGDPSGDLCSRLARLIGSRASAHGHTVVTLANDAGMPVPTLARKVQSGNFNVAELAAVADVLQTTSRALIAEAAS